MGRGSPICKRVCKKIVENFKNNVPQPQIAKALQISSSTVHNIIKRLREIGEISVHNGQGWRSLLVARGLRALRRHCITNDSVIYITKRAQEYFQKPLSVNTIRRAKYRCQLKLYHAKIEQYVNMVQKRCRCPVGKGLFKMVCFKEEKCSMVRRAQIWHSGWKSRTLCPLAKEEGDLPTCYQYSVQKPASLMVWGA